MSSTVTTEKPRKVNLLAHIFQPYIYFPAAAIAILVWGVGSSLYDRHQTRVQLAELATASFSGDESQQFATIHKHLTAIERNGYGGAEDEHNQVVKREEALLTKGMAKGQEGAFEAIFDVGHSYQEYDYRSLRAIGWPELAKIAATAGQSANVYRIAADVYQAGDITPRNSYRAIGLYKNAWLGGDPSIAMPLAKAYVSVGDAADAYLWSLRALHDESYDQDKISIENAIPAAQRPAIQAQAGDAKILTTAGEVAQ